MKRHTGELLMASIRKWTNCDDFHSFTASVHMSILKSPCGVPICNSKLLWLLELEVMLAYWLRESFTAENCGKYMNWILDCLTEKTDGKDRKTWQSFDKGDMHFSFRDVHSRKRSGQNVHGPFSPEQISSSVTSVFFSRKKINPRKHSNVAGGEMFCECRAEHN